MLVYSVRRILHSIVLLLILLIFVFFVTRWLPGDPAYALLDMETATPEEIAAMRQRLGTDRPLHVQFMDFLQGLVRGDLGMSFTYKEPALSVILRVLPHTIRLALGSIFLVVVLGVPLGMLAALAHRRPYASASLLVVSLLGVATPNFWFGLMALVLFSARLGWLPLMGVGDGTFASTIRHLILPCLTLGTSGVGMTVRMTRSCLLEVLGQDYIRTARSKGLSEGRVLIIHAMRNALVNVVTVVGLSLAFLLAGSTLVETVFTRHGLGRLAVGALFARDYVLIQATIAMFAISFVLVNLIVDLTYGFIDPRIRDS